MQIMRLKANGNLECITLKQTISPFVRGSQMDVCVCVCVCVYACVEVPHCCFPMDDGSGLVDTRYESACFVPWI